MGKLQNSKRAQQLQKLVAQYLLRCVVVKEYRTIVQIKVKLNIK